MVVVLATVVVPDMVVDSGGWLWIDALWLLDSTVWFECSGEGSESLVSVGLCGLGASCALSTKGEFLIWVSSSRGSVTLSAECSLLGLECWRENTCSVSTTEDYISKLTCWRENTR